MARSVSTCKLDFKFSWPVKPAYHQFHALFFEHLTDQRALGMSMRVERASLEQVKYLSFVCWPEFMQWFKITRSFRFIMFWLFHWFILAINMIICRLYKPSGQMFLWLPSIYFNAEHFRLQVQKRFESLKKRKDPGTFSEQGDTMRKRHIGCHFSCLVEQLCGQSTDLSTRLLFET
jgi:hypothetical protein